LHIASRYLTHAVVLVAAIMVPAFAVGGMKVHGSAPVVGVLAAERTASPTRGFLLKPEAVSATPRKREIATYTVQDGDTVSAIAARFGVTVDTIRWANGLKDIDTLKLDQKLRVPPVNGVMVRVQPGDTVESLATKYAVDGGAIIDFNLVRDPAHLQPGGELMVPSGEGDPLPQKATDATASASDSSTATPSLGVARLRTGGGSSAHFPWGYCTWYVATKRYVPWNGDAHSWYAAAISYGFPVGRTPQPGAMMVTWESWWGHVAYVESVQGSCWTVSEMNYAGFGIMSYRHICPGGVPLIGFIY
jgi:surface antigen